MKKEWICKKKTERTLWGTFVRWYITAPSGNVYMMYRNCYFMCIRLKNDITSDNNPILAKYDYGNPRSCFNNALKRLYEIEESGKCNISISDALKKCNEYKELYGIS